MFFAMKPKLSDSPLSSASLRQHPQRFEQIIGVSVENFDHLLERVRAQRLEALLSARVCWDNDRVIRLHESTGGDLAEHLCITLLYQRQYMTQAVLGASFGIEQGSVSNIVKRIAPLLLKALPTPEALSHSIADKIESMPPETVENFHMVVIGDGAEQARQRPDETVAQKASYSGKKNCIPPKPKSWERQQA